MLTKRNAGAITISILRGTRRTRFRAHLIAIETGECWRVLKERGLSQGSLSRLSIKALYSIAKAAFEAVERVVAFMSALSA
jgi:mannose/cellobiose epimerase-like protein (N-acyl-D-glucosamine 2-epimerase family)